MGTTLTGTTPQDTYDSLIKVTDNGPLSGTAKFLSDGLGNDSVLALSNARVGIGTASPATTLHVSDAAATTATFNSTFGQLSIGLLNNGSTFGQIGSGVAVTPSATATDLGFGTAGGASTNIVFATGASFTERMRITSAGDAQFGDGNNFNPVIQYAGSGRVAASPAYSFRGDLDTGMFNPNTGNTIAFATAGVERFRITDNGVTFNGDTAAANALDDYEEGTFTATLKGSTTDPTTPVTTTGTYTKIGRQVQVNVFFDNVNTTGAAGDVIVAGLPFTSSATTMRFTGSVLSFNFTFTGTSNAAFMGNSSTQFEILSSTTNAAWSNMSHLTTGGARFLVVSLTYFV
jgi:hypothetical protein